MLAFMQDASELWKVFDFTDAQEMAKAYDLESDRRGKRAKKAIAVASAAASATAGVSGLSL